MRGIGWAAALGACAGGTTKTTPTGDTAPAVTTDAVVADWDAWVAAHDACTVPGDCVAVTPECPLGCWAFVSADAVDDAVAEAARLQAMLGAPCDYSCEATPDPQCDGGRCVQDP